MAFYNNLGSTICQSMGWNEDMWSSGSLDKLNCKMRKKVPIDSLQILPHHGNHLLIILHIHKVGNSGKSLYIYIIMLDVVRRFPKIIPSNNESAISTLPEASGSCSPWPSWSSLVSQGQDSGGLPISNTVVYCEPCEPKKVDPVVLLCVLAIVFAWWKPDLKLSCHSDVAWIPVRFCGLS